MFRGLISRSGSQKGLLLINVLVAAGIASVIALGISMSIFNVLNVNAMSTNHVNAVKQVESAVFWISRDVLMSQSIQPGEGSGFPLNLSWTDWDNVVHQICYTLENGQLRRSYSTDGQEQSQTIIAEFIDTGSGKTSCDYFLGEFTLKITASLGGFKPASETRVAKVIPRPTR